MRVVVQNAIDASWQHLTHPDDHLQFIYFQQTMFTSKEGIGTSIEDTTKAKNERDYSTKRIRDWVPFTGGAHANLDYYLDMLRVADGRFPKGDIGCGGLLEEGQNLRRQMGFRPPNVISHDFVNNETCKKIISLNRELDGGW